MPTQSQHGKAVAWAQKNLGQHEEPPGSNTGTFVISCQRASWLPGTRYPWCVCFWLKAWTQAGRKLPYLGAGAYMMLGWYRQHLPGWVVASKDAKPGAAVILNIGAGHCALLEKPYDGGPLVHTIDGNWGDKVSRVAHPASLVRGCIDPPEKAGTIVPIAKPPVYEVVTSASGHAKVVFVGGSSQVAAKVGGLLNRFGGLTIRKHKTTPGV